MQKDVDSEVRGFTLIELLIVIALVGILSVVVVLVINPPLLIEQSRDSSRLSDMKSLSGDINLGVDTVGSSLSLGSPNTVYVSIPDPIATSSAGDQCQGLGLAVAPSGWSYHCAASSTVRKVDGTGWVPINFNTLPGGAPLSALPIDPVNQTSTYLYYTYAANSSEQYQLYGHFESPSYQAQEAADSNGAGYDPAVYALGTNINIAPFAGGMVAYWPFDEGSGTTVDDYSGSNATATLQGGVSWTTGKINGAVSFDGVNTTRVFLNEDLVGGSPLTVSLWIYPTSLSGENATLFTDGGTVCSVYGSLGNYTLLCSNNGYTSYIQTPSFSINLNQWQYVTVVRNSSGQFTIYINGVQQGAANQSGGSFLYQLPITQLGNLYPYATSEPFLGKMDELRIYQRALNGIEVDELYTAG